jgi:hypothetical protein
MSKRVILAWTVVLSIVIARAFWTDWFGFSANRLAVDILAFVLATGIALAVFISTRWNKNIVIAFSPLVIIAALPVVLVALTLVAWTVGGFGP